MPKINPLDVEKLTQDLIDRGCLIAAGWVSFRALTIPADAPSLQVKEMRTAFFAGAQHLFASILTMLEPGDEASENDTRRMTEISAELELFAAQFNGQLGMES